MWQKNIGTFTTQNAAVLAADLPNTKQVFSDFVLRTALPELYFIHKFLSITRGIRHERNFRKQGTVVSGTTAGNSYDPSRVYTVHPNHADAFECCKVSDTV